MSDSMAETKYLIFALGNQHYGIRLDIIRGIEQSYTIVPIPTGANYIKGMIHLRESVIPIYDLKLRFSIFDEGDKPKQLLITETHNMSLGIEVDDVVSIVSLPQEQIKKVPVVVRNDETLYMENIINVSNVKGGFGENEPEIMISVSIDNIMSEEEFADVANALEEGTEE